MKRDRALVAFLCLLIILTANPSMSSIPAAIVDEAQEGVFSTAADGAESSESITSFSSTLDDDVMFYPDAFLNDTVVVASGGMLYAGDAPTGDYTDTHEVGDPATYWVVLDSNPGEVNFSVYFETPSSIQVEGVRVAIYYLESPALTHDTQDVMMRKDGGVWETIGAMASDAWTWLNFTTYDPDYWNSSYVEVGLYLDSAASQAQGYIRYAEVTFYEMHLADSDHYAEGFNDVGDWTTSDTSISTDDDVATITENGAGSTGRAYDPISSTDYFEHYYEFRIYSMTATTANLEFWDGAAYNTLKTFTTAGTYKGIISDTDATTMQRIGFFVGSEGGNIKPDYLRIGPADEMGWQHDGSTTAGLTVSDDATISSDGSLLSIIKGAGGSSAWFWIDLTTTLGKYDPDYYPFLEVRFSSACIGNDTAIYLYDGASYHYLTSYFTITQTTYRFNVRAMTGNDIQRVRIFASTAGGRVEVDYVQAYSIANWTYSSSGVGDDDYLYVDSGVLYSSVDDGYIELNHDPALSVAQASYPVYNLTTSGTAPQFSQYVSEWSTYSDNTRGATTSGTVTDIKLKFDSMESISALKFIEDGTAPAVVRSSSTPNDPEDDESITLSAVVTDALEVWTVAFNAIVYPAGFSDVDYDATEQADNLWTYEFSSLITGYYCFKIIASDGANNNALTEFAYIELTVREAAIMVEEITLIGAGSDFEMVTFSARINRDCSYTIYEESASSAESDTHTGSVTAPSFNLAWTKLDVDDSNVNFTIKFTSGSLTYNYTSQYQVAQTTFYVSTVMQIEGLDTVTITGRISKLGAYQLYDEQHTLKETGSITDLDFTVRFNKWSGYDEQDHDFAIKFTNGSQSCWYNSSYYAFKKPAVAPVPTTDENALYAFQVSFWTLVAVVAVGGMVGVSFYRKEIK